MDIEELNDYCGKWKAVSTDIKWEDHLVYSVHSKMFLIIDKNNQRRYATIKAHPDDYETMVACPEFRPAPHLACYKWVQMDNRDSISKDEFKELVKESYIQVVSKMSKKLQKETEFYKP